MRVNSDRTQFNMYFKQPIAILGDIDTLLQLKLYKLKSPTPLAAFSQEPYYKYLKSPIKEEPNPEEDIQDTVNSPAAKAKIEEENKSEIKISSKYKSTDSEENIENNNDNKNEKEASLFVSHSEQNLTDINVEKRAHKGSGSGLTESCLIEKKIEANVEINLEKERIKGGGVFKRKKRETGNDDDVELSLNAQESSNSNVSSRKKNERRVKNALNNNEREDDDEDENENERYAEYKVRINEMGLGCSELDAFNESTSKELMKIKEEGIQKQMQQNLSLMCDKLPCFQNHHSDTPNQNKNQNNSNSIF